MPRRNSATLPASVPHRQTPTHSPVALSFPGSAAGATFAPRTAPPTHLYIYSHAHVHLHAHVLRPRHLHHHRLVGLHQTRRLARPRRCSQGRGARAALLSGRLARRRARHPPPTGRPRPRGGAHRGHDRIGRHRPGHGRAAHRHEPRRGPAHPQLLPLRLLLGLEKQGGSGRRDGPPARRPRHARHPRRRDGRHLRRPHRPPRGRDGRPDERKPLAHGRRSPRPGPRRRAGRRPRARHRRGRCRAFAPRSRRRPGPAAPPARAPSRGPRRCCPTACSPRGRHPLPAALPARCRPGAGCEGCCRLCHRRSGCSPHSCRRAPSTRTPHRTSTH